MASRAMKENAPIVWTRNRGRNGWDTPSDVPAEMSVESLNVEIVQNALGRRRQGSVLQPIEGDPRAPAVLARFALQQDDHATLHYTTRTGGGINAMGVDAVVAALTMSDPIQSAPQLATWAVLNGKLHWAYDSAVNRLHVYDPRTGNTVRRSGLSPTRVSLILGDTATAGTYAPIPRYYRARLMRIDNTVTLIGEASPAAGPWTPSGTKDGVAVTLPVGPAESETHWRVEVSLDNAVWYVLSDPISLDTQFYVDRTPTTEYATKPAAPLAGEHAPFPSVKYLCADQDRLLGFGVWEPSTTTEGVPPRSGRVYFTPVLDSTDTDDDERIDYGPAHPGYIDVGRNKGYEDRALAGPLDGQFFAFQSKGIHMLVPTGDVTQPFRRITLSPSLGAVSHHSTFIGEDETGAPCLYFLEPKRGPYRYGARGLEWCGYDVQDVWKTVNHAATEVVAHGHYDPTLRAVIWFLATGTANAPDQTLVFFVREGQPTAVEGVRYGCVRWFGTPWVGATSSLLFARTLHGIVLSPDETGYLATAAGLVKINMPGVRDDVGTPFLAEVQSPEFAPTRLVEKTPATAFVQGSAHADPIVTIRQRLAGDFGRVAKTAECTLTPLGSETRVLRALPALSLPGDVTTFRVTLGDPGAVKAAAWTIDEWALTYEIGGEA